MMTVMQGGGGESLDIICAVAPTRGETYQPSTCHGCGTRTPVWPLGWFFPDEPVIAWCPDCLVLFNQ